MKNFESFELAANIRAAGITACDNVKLLINTCKVYSGPYGSICIENIDTVKSVIDIETDETNHIKIIDWLRSTRDWLLENKRPGDKYMVNMFIENLQLSMYSASLENSSFFKLALYEVQTWLAQNDYAEYDEVDGFPSIKIPRKRGRLKFYSKVPSIRLEMFG